MHSGTLGYRLCVSVDGVAEIDTCIADLYARTIAVLAWKGLEHCSERPHDLPVVMGRIALAVEASLQTHPVSHAIWLKLCDDADRSIQVELHASRSSTAVEEDPFDGGTGGDAGWFGAGGGGGGSGLLRGGGGGAGADGAIVIFQIAEDDRLIDVDVFVMAGSGSWAPSSEVHRLDVVAIGGGGGGGAGAGVH